MSLSILRNSPVLKHLPSSSARAPAPRPANARSASGHASHHNFYGAGYEAYEGFGNSLFLLTGAGLVGLALYQAYSPSNSQQFNSDSAETSDSSLLAVAQDEQKPWLTRYLAYHFVKDPDKLKQVAAHNMAVVFDAADTAYYKASIDRPPIRRMANAGDFKIASPYGLVPGTETDFSDLRIKSYRDDMHKPDTHDTSGREGGHSE